MFVSEISHKLTFTYQNDKVCFMIIIEMRVVLRRRKILTLTRYAIIFLSNPDQMKYIFKCRIHIPKMSKYLAYHFLKGINNFFFL